MLLEYNEAVCVIITYRIQISSSYTHAFSAIPN